MAKCALRGLQRLLDPVLVRLGQHIYKKGDEYYAANFTEAFFIIAP